MLRRQGSPGLAAKQGIGPTKARYTALPLPSLRWLHSDYFSAATVQVSQKVSEGSK